MKKTLQTALIICLVGLLCCVMVNEVFSQDEYSAIDLWGAPSVQIGQREGLQSLYFKDFHQDQDGFMWICTYDALCRFDGLNIEQIALDSFSSIQHVGMVEDRKRKTLYVGSIGDVYKVDLISGKLESVQWQME